MDSLETEELEELSESLSPQSEEKISKNEQIYDSSVTDKDQKIALKSSDVSR